MGDPLLWLAIFAAIAAVGVLRLAWAQPRRSVPLNGVGWGFIVLAALAGGIAEGAWGVAVAALCGMGAAFAALGMTAIMSLPGGTRASNRRANMLPERNEKLHLSRRLSTFVLVAVLALAAALCLAVAARTLAYLAGAGEADANVAGLFVMPLAWAILSYRVLMERRRARQVLILAACAAVLLPVLLAGRFL